jgi:hypothetical protein
MTIDPVSPTILYVTAKTVDPDQARLYRFENSGQSWQRSQFSPDGGATYTDTLDAFIRQIAIDPSDNNYVYLMVENQDSNDQGLYRSMDHGFHYSRIVSFPPDGRVAVGVSMSGTVFASFDGGLWRSGDHGDTWTGPLNTEPDCEGEPDAHYIGFHPTNPNTVYLTQRNQLYQFNGWQTTSVNTTTINPVYPDLQAHQLVFDPTDPLTGYLAASHDGSGLYKTTDGGSTWTPTSLTNVPIRSLLLVTHTHGVTLYAGTIEGDGLPGRIYRSLNNGTSWEILEEFPDLSITVLEVVPDDPQHLFAGTAGSTGQYPDSFLFQSRDAGETWAKSDFGQYLPGCGDWTADIAVDPRNTDHVFVANANNGNMCHSVDGGQSWVAPYYIWVLSRGIGKASVVHIHRLPLVIVPDWPASNSSIQAQTVTTQSLLYMGTNSGVYRRILEDSYYYFPVIMKAATP